VCAQSDEVFALIEENDLAGTCWGLTVASAQVARVHKEIEALLASAASWASKASKAQGEYRAYLAERAQVELEEAYHAANDPACNSAGIRFFA